MPRKTKPKMPDFPLVNVSPVDRKGRQRQTQFRMPVCGYDEASALGRLELIDHVGIAAVAGGGWLVDSLRGGEPEIVDTFAEAVAAARARARALWEAEIAPALTRAA